MRREWAYEMPEGELGEAPSGTRMLVPESRRFLGDAAQFAAQDALNTLRVLSAHVGCLVEATPGPSRGELVEEIRQGTQRLETLLHHLAAFIERS